VSATAWSRLRALFRREKRELDDALADAISRGNQALDRRERELAASPEERLAIERERAAAQDDEYEALRRKIEGGQE
jgi:hypothetical protein